MISKRLRRAFQQQQSRSSFCPFLPRTSLHPKQDRHPRLSADAPLVMCALRTSAQQTHTHAMCLTRSPAVLEASCGSSFFFVFVSCRAMKPFASFLHFLLVKCTTALRYSQRDDSPHHIRTMRPSSVGPRHSSDACFNISKLLTATDCQQCPSKAICHNCECEMIKTVNWSLRACSATQPSERTNTSRARLRELLR